MKKLLILILLLPVLLCCQPTNKSDTSLVDFMLRKAYISKHEADQISNDSLFISIYDIYCKRYDLSRGQRRMLFLTFPQKKSKTYKLIHKLNELGLITKTTFDDLINKFENRAKDNLPVSSSISDELELFQYLYELKKSKQNPERIKHYLNDLKNLNIISDFQEGQAVHSKWDIIQLIHKKLIINLDSLPKSIDDSYFYALNQIKKLDKSLEISDFSFAIEDYQHDEYSFQFAMTRFSNSGRNYISRNSYDEDYKSINPNDKLDPDFYCVFNKVLTDNGSDYRIMSIEGVDENRICLLLLNKEQLQFLKEKEKTRRFQYFDPEWYKIKGTKYWNSFKLIGQQETEKYFTTYDSLGLFNHLSSKQKEEEFNKLKLNFLYNAETILYEVENICLGFDWEMSSDDKPYKTAIENFASITRGEFTPQNIKDNFSFSNEDVDISFEFKGKTYNTSTEVSGDWYSTKFLELINEAIQENNLSGKYYDLPDGGQMSGHIYLTKDQYNYLVKHDLMEFYKED